MYRIFVAIFLIITSVHTFAKADSTFVKPFTFALSVGFPDASAVIGIPLSGKVNKVDYATKVGFSGNAVLYLNLRKKLSFGINVGYSKFSVVVRNNEILKPESEFSNIRIIPVLKYIFKQNDKNSIYFTSGIGIRYAFIKERYEKNLATFTTDTILLPVVNARIGFEKKFKRASLFFEVGAECPLLSIGILF